MFPCRRPSEDDGTGGDVVEGVGTDVETVPGDPLVSESRLGPGPGTVRLIYEVRLEPT